MPTHTSCERRVRHTLSALAPPVSCGCVWPLAHRTTPDAVPTNRVVRAVRRHASILTHDRSAPQLRRSDPRHPFGWSAGTRCTHSYHVRTRPPCGPRVGRPACNTAVRAILHSRTKAGAALHPVPMPLSRVLRGCHYNWCAWTAAPLRRADVISVDEPSGQAIHQGSM
jgi:hypothetical protein